MAQQTKIGRHKTTFGVKDGILSVVYHSTEVVRADLNRRTVIFNNGGYETATTKTRMNQALRQFNIPLSVLQADYEWFVNNADGQVLEFVNDKIYTW